MGRTADWTKPSWGDEPPNLMRRSVESGTLNRTSSKGERTVRETALNDAVADEADAADVDVDAAGKLGAGVDAADNPRTSSLDNTGGEDPTSLLPGAPPVLGRESSDCAAKTGSSCGGPSLREKCGTAGLAPTEDRL